jgi:hypothetical protein
MFLLLVRAVLNRLFAAYIGSLYLTFQIIKCSFLYFSHKNCEIYFKNSTLISKFFNKNEIQNFVKKLANSKDSTPLKLKLAIGFIIENRRSKTTQEILNLLEKNTSEKEYINLIVDSFGENSKLENFLLNLSLLDN